MMKMMTKKKKMMMRMMMMMKKMMTKMTKKKKKKMMMMMMVMMVTKLMMILLLVEILQHFMGSLSHHLQGLIHPSWYRDLRHELHGWKNDTKWSNKHDSNLNNQLTYEYVEYIWWTSWVKCLKRLKSTPYLHYEGKLPLAVKSVTRCVNTTDRTNNVDACMYMSIYIIYWYIIDFPNLCVCVYVALLKPVRLSLQLSQLPLQSDSWVVMGVQSQQKIPQILINPH